MQLTEVDFDQIKQNLINYLKSTKEFTDYSFEGSNLQMILNLISYKAQMNAYTANMVANESFLASATVRDNVVAHAKTLGYLPASATCAVARLNVEVKLNPADYATIPYPAFVYLEPGPAFSVSRGDDYVFNVVDRVMGIVSNNGIINFTNVTVYEGTRAEIQFTIDENDPTQKFILNNARIDSSTIRVRVRENPLNDLYFQYNPANSLPSVSPTDRIYWISEISGNRYELTFGDDLFGRKLPNGAVIEVSYMTTNGNSGNGIQRGYNFIGKLMDDAGNRIVGDFRVIDSGISVGGSEPESIQSIKFRAPMSYGAQKRCVTPQDYETLIRQIYPAVDDIYVFGGEQLEIPEFGRVFVVIKPTSGESLSNITKAYIKKSLEPYRIASLDIAFLDPTVIYVEVISSVKFNDRVTKKDPTAIISDVRSFLSLYSKAASVSKFGGSIRYSKIVAAIDDADFSITRNNTYLRMRRDIRVLMNAKASYEICFLQAFELSCDSVSVWSSGFKLEGSDRLYYFEDDRNGSIVLFYFNEFNEKIIENKEFGTVDYDKGEIMLGYSKPIVFTYTSEGEDTLQIRAMPRSQDIIATQQSYLSLDVSSSSISAVVDSLA